jgi:assimilatory nitrate reductase catalytic subunit
VALPTAQLSSRQGTIGHDDAAPRCGIVGKPSPGVRTDLAAVAGLAFQFGQGTRSAAGSRAWCEEPRRASASGTVDYAGVTWERVDAEDGVFWPCPSVDWPDTSRLFVEALSALHTPSAGDRPC